MCFVSYYTKVTLGANLFKKIRCDLGLSRVVVRSELGSERLLNIQNPTLIEDWTKNEWESIFKALIKKIGLKFVSKICWLIVLWLWNFRQPIVGNPCTGDSHRFSLSSPGWTESLRTQTHGLRFNDRSHEPILFLEIEIWEKLCNFVNE